MLITPIGRLASVTHQGNLERFVVAVVVLFIAQSCPTLCDPVDCRTQAPLSSTVSWNLLRFMSTESVMLSNHLTLCHPLFLLPLVFPSIKVFLVSCLFTSAGQSIGA